MSESTYPTAVSLSDVFDPDTFRALAIHIAMGSLPEEEQDDAYRE